MTFALWVTVHVVLAVAFLFAWRIRLAAASFLLVPVAPLLALRNGRGALGVLWVVAAAAYVTLLVVARS